MKRNKHWYKGPERQALRRQRIMLGVTAAMITAIVVIHYQLYTLIK